MNESRFIGLWNDDMIMPNDEESFDLAFSVGMGYSPREIAEHFVDKKDWNPSDAYCKIESGEIESFDRVDPDDYDLGALAEWLIEDYPEGIKEY